MFVILPFLRRKSAALALMLFLVSACTSPHNNFTPISTPHKFTPTPMPLTLTQISSDPYTNSTSQHKTEVEPGTFSFGNTIVAAFKAGRFYKGGASNIGWATSINGGLTWTYGFLPGTTWGMPKTTADRASGLGGQPLVQPNGTVIVPIIVFTSSSTIENIAAFQSNDGGESWSSNVLITRSDYHHPKGGMRVPFPFPSAAIDRSGNVYVVWPDCRFETGCSANDLVLSASSNGKTWLAVQRIPIDPVDSGVDHFLPGLAVDPSTSGSTGHLVLVFYYYPKANCNSSTCLLEVGSTSSTDGGNTWSLTNHLAGPMKLSWLASTSQGAMVGDYISTSFSNGKAYPIFAAATAPAGKVFDEAMFTVSGGIT